MVHQKGGRSLLFREKRGSRQMYNTEMSRPSFPLVLVGKIPGKYRPIPNRNTELGYNSRTNTQRMKCSYCRKVVHYSLFCRSTKSPFGTRRSVQFFLLPPKSPIYIWKKQSYICWRDQISVQISADICRYLQISAGIWQISAQRHNLPCNP